jgi:hypothetical protein
MNKKLTTIILSVIVYLAATGISYFIFAGQSTAGPNGTNSQTTGENKNTGNDYQALTFDPNAPKTEECPINGVLYGKDQKDWWQKHRPLGVMIENSKDARPQSGIPSADITYEAVAEGGITRTLNVYYCQDAGIVGPVRSARTYFLDFISEYGSYPLYAHVGGANTPGPANALGQIGDYGWAGYNDLNQFSIGYPTFWRDENRLDHEVATEHTMYSTTSKLWAVGAKRGLTNVDKDEKAWDEDYVKYAFKDEAAESERGESQSITVPFWDYDDYIVDWNYDKASNTYLRNNGGVAHMDRNTKKQLNTKNLVILFMKESHADDGYEDNAHMLYDTTGTGKAFIFMNGKQIKGTWKKADRTARTTLYDAAGKEIAFNRGHIWFEIVASNADIVVK